MVILIPTLYNNDLLPVTSVINMKRSIETILIILTMFYYKDNINELHNMHPNPFIVIINTVTNININNSDNNNNNYSNNNNNFILILIELYQ